MAEQIRAEEGAIEKGATAVDNARSGIENRIKDIEAKMAELGSFWSGDAAVSFNALMSSWQEKATSLNNILIDLSDNLRGTAKDQAANEEDNQSRTKSIAQELENLNSQVSALIGQWDGSAREAYHQAQRNWDGKLQEMNQILGQISQATSQIAQQYVESDARSAGRF